MLMTAMEREQKLEGGATAVAIGVEVGVGDFAEVVPVARAGLLAPAADISLTWHTTVASTPPRRSAPLSRGGARVRRAESGFLGGGVREGHGGAGEGWGVLLLYSPGGLPVGITVSSPFPVLLLLTPASLLST